MRSFFVSILSLVLLLSLLGNAYFYYSRITLASVNKYSITNNAASSLSGATMNQRVLQPLAFGDIVLPALPAEANACDELLRGGKDNGECRALKTAAVPAKGPQQAGVKDAKVMAMTPVHFVYTMSGDLLPHLPTSLPLYRDQGANIAFQPFLDTLKAMHVPIDTGKFALIPDSVHLQTPDGTYTVVLQPFARMTTVTRNHRQSAYTLDGAKITLPSDASVIAAANDFALSLGIQPDVYGRPIVLRPLTVSGSVVDASIDVVWPMILAGKPVIDAQARPVGALAIHLSLPSLQPEKLVVRQFDENLLSTSDYTAANVNSLQSAVQSGGVHAPFTFDKGAMQKVPVIDANLAYFFVQDPDGRIPTYFVPVVTATFNLPANCPTCGSLAWRSFFPALDSQHFSFAKSSTPIVESKKLVR